MLHSSCCPTQNAPATRKRRRPCVLTSRGLGRVQLTGQLTMFLALSGFAAACNFFTGYFFYSTLGFAKGWGYTISVALGFSVGMLVSFMLNRQYTFGPSCRGIIDEFRRFVIVSLGGLLLTAALASLLCDIAVPWVFANAFNGGNVTPPVKVETLSHLLSIAVVAFYSFAAHKTFSFAQGARKQCSPPINPIGVER